MALAGGWARGGRAGRAVIAAGRTCRGLAGGAPLGLAFDLDGCLVRGKKAIESAPATLRRVRRLGLPHVFLTNGGGVTEADKAEELRAILGEPVEERQVLLAHTPMRELADQYRDAPVLVLARGKETKVAASYGFRRPISASHFLRRRPSVWPFSYVHRAGAVAGELSLPPMSEADHSPHLRPEDTEAVMVLIEGMDWGPELQIVCDALMGGLRRRGRQTPLYFSADDFVWANDHDHPRFGQGAFRIALAGLWRQLSGGLELEYTCYGKPTARAYRFAQRRLEELAGGPVPVVYGLGDNPLTDVRGANLNGWRSALVHTGVFHPQGARVNCEVDPAHVAAADVGRAVEEILRREGLAGPP